MYPRLACSRVFAGKHLGSWCVPVREHRSSRGKPPDGGARLTALWPRRNTPRSGALDRSFTGKVVRFTRDVNFETRTMETEVDVENKDLSIDPGMYANTQLQLSHAENVLTIPVEALVFRDHRDMVYVLDSQNRVHQRAVEVGLRGSGRRDKSRLAAGERVIVGGQENTREGELVDARG